MMDPKYVIKFLKNSVLDNPAVVKLGLKDMKIEIEMLQRLRHTNIIGMRAFGTMEFDTDDQDNNNNNNKQQQQEMDEQPNLGSASSSSSSPSMCPYVVLDRMGDTLEDKCRYWTVKHLQRSTFVGKLVTHRNHTKSVFCGQERWQILCDMASALTYLHKRRYVPYLLTGTCICT